MCRTSIYEARNNFSAYVEMAEQGEPVEITRYNKPVAIIISYDDYEKKFRKSSSESWLTKWRKENEGFLCESRCFGGPGLV